MTVIGSVLFPEDNDRLEAFFASSDVDRFYADSMRIDACAFPTRVGSVYGNFPYECGNYSVGPSLRFKKIVDDGWDPLKDLVERAGMYGVRIYPAMRIALHRDPPQHLPQAWPNMVFDNRQYWVKDRSGVAYAHASLSVQAVRQIIIEVFEDVVSRYNVAGISIIGLRGWPWIGYEAASAKMFEEEYGFSIYDVDEGDPRFTDHRCRIFTMFMRELRKAMNKAANTRGREISVAFDTMNCIENARFQGQDIVKWAQEGLIDELTLNACHFPSRPVNESNPSVDLTRDVRDAIGDPSFSVRPHLWPRFMAPNRFLERAEEIWDARIEGVALWDLAHRTSRLTEWAVQSLLGHRDQYQALREECHSYWRSYPIDEMDGICMKNPDYSANSSG